MFSALHSPVGNSQLHKIENQYFGYFMVASMIKSLLERRMLCTLLQEVPLRLMNVFEANHLGVPTPHVVEIDENGEALIREVEFDTMTSVLETYGRSSAVL